MDVFHGYVSHNQMVFILSANRGEKKHQTFETSPRIRLRLDASWRHDVHMDQHGSTPYPVPQPRNMNQVLVGIFFLGHLWWIPWFFIPSCFFMVLFIMIFRSESEPGKNPYVWTNQDRAIPDHDPRLMGTMSHNRCISGILMDCKDSLVAICGILADIIFLPDFKASFHRYHKLSQTFMAYEPHHHTSSTYINDYKRTCNSYRVARW